MKTVEQLDAEAAVLGQVIITHALENNDLECVRALKSIGVGLMDVVIDLAKGKADYPTWHKAFIELNKNADIGRFDPTGKWEELLDNLTKVDMSGYYFEQVIPVISQPINELESMKTIMESTFDNLKEMIVAKRRSQIKAV